MPHRPSTFLAGLLGWLLTVVALLVSSFPLSLLFVYSQFQGNARFPAGCALVFGSAVAGGGEAGPGIRRRIEAASALYRAAKVRRLIVSGGRGEGSIVSEAQVMREEALRLGVPERDVQVEERSTSTWENIQFAQPLLQGCSSVVAVSDRYHLARIRLTAWRQGVTLGTFPASQLVDPLFEVQAVVREALGNLVYFVRQTHTPSRHAE